MNKVFLGMDGKVITDFTLDSVTTEQIERGVTWIDLQNPTERELEFLSERFHPLAVEDCRGEGQRPKMDDYENFLFFIFRGINYYSGTHALDTIGLKIFLTPHLLVTVHQKSSKTIDEVIQRIKKNPLLLGSTDHLFYTILDGLTDNILPVIRHIEERLETFQHNIFKKFSPGILEETFELKKWVLRLKRYVKPQQELIEILIKEEHPLVSKDLNYFLRDVSDHTQDVLEHLEMYEQLFPDAMNSYLSQVTNRMNEIMKMMSIIATLMLPLTFISGIFGMNFVKMPLIQMGLEGFWIVIGVMLVILVGMITYFSKKDWF